MVCATEVQLRFFKFVVFNPCESSPSLTILVSLWFIIISLVFFFLSKLLFSGFFNLKVILYEAKITQKNVTELFKKTSQTHLQ